DLAPALWPVPAAMLAEVLDRRPALSPVARAAVRHLVGQPGPVMVLRGVPGRDRLVEQAATLEAARASWEASGVGVGLDAGAGDVARWTALAGLREAEAGTPLGVIVVDRADRRTSAELLGLLRRAEKAHASVVLVEGGTLPARQEPRSAALDGLRRLAGHRGTDDLAPLPVMEVETLAHRSPPAAESGRIVATATTADAVGTILNRWAMVPAGRRPVMVALGPPEAEALNRFARNALVDAGEVGTAQVVIGGRSFAPGDRVLARRPGPAPSASLGTVESVTPTPPTVTVRWDGPAEHATRVDAWNAQRLVHGYAVTAGVAARLSGSVLLLGDPGQAPRLANREVTGIVIAPIGDRRRDPLDRLMRLAEIVSEATPAGPHRRLGAGRPATLEAETPATIGARRDRLEAELRAGLPPDTASERRRLDEDRAYAAAHPGRPGSPDARDLGRRAAQLSRSEAIRADWLQANAGRLLRWRELGRLIDEHTDLAAYAATLDPGSAAQLVTGHAPADPGLRPAWERAVRATAIHAARWSRDDNRGDRSPAESATLRRRDQAIDALDTARKRKLGQGVKLRTLGTRANAMGRDTAGLDR
ncbi:MAG: hypothetical protein J2O47_06990, partial [Acidimicrobiaceae bacterium]|nr:hypothetical protein [Acidimicrobiaceae bacterium]